jgi:hypothetical protein
MEHENPKQGNAPKSGRSQAIRLLLKMAAVFVAVFVGTPFLLIYGLPLLPPEYQSAKGSSIEAIRKAFPSLEGLNILACEYTATKEERYSIVPSPYNSMYECFGWATLDAESASSFRSRGSWQSADPSRIPSSLKGILPPDAKFVSSIEVDESFSNLRSAHFCRVVMPVSGNTLYFITRDDDHAFRD